VDVKDHATGVVAYFGVGMCGCIVQEMDKGFDSSLGSALLRGSRLSGDESRRRCGRR
jgi:hypothetical protein